MILGRGNESHTVISTPTATPSQILRSTSRLNYPYRPRFLFETNHRLRLHEVPVVPIGTQPYTFPCVIPQEPLLHAAPLFCFQGLMLVSSNRHYLRVLRTVTAAVRAIEVLHFESISDPLLHTSSLLSSRKGGEAQSSWSVLTHNCRCECFS